MSQHRWMIGPGNGALEALAPVAQGYAIADNRREAAREGIVASVHVEALWSDDPVDETHWLDRLDKQDGVALHYVANARLGSPQADRLIAAQAANPRVVAVRGILSYIPIRRSASWTTLISPRTRPGGATSRASTTTACTLS